MKRSLGVGLCLVLAGVITAQAPARAAGYAHWGPDGVVVAHGAPVWHGGCCYGSGVGVGLAAGVVAGAAVATAARPPAVTYYGYPAVYAAPPMVYAPRPVVYAAPPVVYAPGYAYVR